MEEDDEVVVLLSSQEYQLQIVSSETEISTIDHGINQNAEITGNDRERCSVIKYGTKTSERYFLNAEQHYFCQFCETSFKVESEYNQHFLISNDTNKNKSHKCEDCGRNCATKMGLSSHSRKHSKTENGYKCGICGKTFPMYTQMNQHKLSHKGVISFKCEVCGMRFDHTKKLRVHMKCHPFWCETCQKDFRTIKKFKQHKSRRHPLNKLYLCEICGRRFALMTSLIIHRFSHTGEKPFKCDTCKKGFRTPDLLTKHKKFHTGERRYKCDKCRQSYTWLSALNKHKREKHVAPPPENFYGYKWATLIG